MFIPYEPLPDGNLAVEQMDGVGYGSYASAVRSPLSYYLTKRLQLPDYDHNRDPKSVAAPTFDWPTPLPPLDVDWEVDSPEVFEYVSKVLSLIHI